jgi:hypothetical protein
MVRSAKERVTFYYKTARGNFRVEISEREIEERSAYSDIRILFSIEIVNESYPEWKVSVANTRGRVNKIEDEGKLVEKLEDEIKSIINLDREGEASIDERILDLTKEIN